jgi:hypothetical protein
MSELQNAYEVSSAPAHHSLSRAGALHHQQVSDHWAPSRGPPCLTTSISNKFLMVPVLLVQTCILEAPGKASFLILLRIQLCSSKTMSQHLLSYTWHRQQRWYFREVLDSFHDLEKACLCPLTTLSSWIKVLVVASQRSVYSSCPPRVVRRRLADAVPTTLAHLQLLAQNGYYSKTSSIGKRSKSNVSILRT